MYVPPVTETVVRIVSGNHNYNLPQTADDYGGKYPPSSNIIPTINNVLYYFLEEKVDNLVRKIK